MSIPSTPPTSRPLVATQAPTTAPQTIPKIVVTPPINATTHPPPVSVIAPTIIAPKITAPSVANTVSRNLLRATLTLSTQISKLDHSTSALHKTYKRRLGAQMRENRQCIFNHLYAAALPSLAAGGGEDCGVVDVSDPVAADEKLQLVIARAYQVESEKRCERARGLYAAAVQRAEVAMEAVEEFDRVVVELPGRVDGVLRGCGGGEDEDKEDEGKENEDEGKRERQEEQDGEGIGKDGEEDEEMDSVLQDRGEGGCDLAGKLLRDSLALKRKIDGILREGEKKRRREEEEDAHGRYDYNIVSVSLRHSLMLKRRLDAMYQKSRHGMEIQG